MWEACKKIPDLQQYLSEPKSTPDIFAITETRLNHTNNQVSNHNLEGYDFYHRDSHTLAGGVGLYVKSSLTANCRDYVIIMPIAFTLWLQLPWLCQRWLPALPYVEFGAAGPRLFSRCSAAVVLVPLSASLRVLTCCFYCSVLVF